MDDNNTIINLELFKSNKIHVLFVMTITTTREIIK